jgi:hypothetical protein
MIARRAWLPILAVAIGLFVVRPAFAGPWSLKPGEYATDVSGGWYSAYHYGDEDATQHRLVNGGEYEQRTASWLTEMGWKKSMSVVFGLPFTSITRNPGNAEALRTTTVLGDGLFGLKWKLANGARAAAIEADVSFPMGYSKDLTLTHADSVAATRPDGTVDWNVARQLSPPVAGDGQTTLTGTLQLGTAIGKAGFLSGYGGYEYHGKDYQSRIRTGADLAFWFRKSWLIGGRYRGASALSVSGTVLGWTSDNVTHDTSYHEAGPVITYRVDDHIDVFASTMHTITVKNGLHTDEVRFGFTFKQTKLNRLQGYLGSTQHP